LNRVEPTRSFSRYLELEGAFGPAGSLSAIRRLTRRYEATTSTTSAVIASAWNGNSGMAPVEEVCEPVDCRVEEAVVC
jgi:hypothetical protein